MHPWLERFIPNKSIIASKKLNETTLTNNTKKIKNKNKQKEKNKNKKKKPNQSRRSKLTTSQKLEEYLADSDYYQSRDDEKDTLFGDSYKQKAEGTVRLWFTNPCGIGLDHKNSKSHASLKFMKLKSKSDVVGLAETNVNWKLLTNNSSLYSRLKCNWKNFRSITSNNMLEEMGKCQRGGTCSFVVGQLSHRTSATGKDISGLGRWVWIEFQGKGEKRTRIYTAYRTTGQKPSNSKLTTVYDQQMRHIRRKSLNCTPRELFDRDIVTEIQLQQSRNIQVILMIDVNENVESGEFTKSMDTLGLQSVFKRYIHEPMPATHHTGSQPISTIYLPIQICIKSAGILQKGKGFQSDHRNMFVDVDEHTLLGSQMFKVLPPDMKTLQLNDSRIYRSFIKELRSHLQATNTFERAEALTLNIPKSESTREHVVTMESIDAQLGRGIKHALKKCRKKRMGSIPYSALFLEVWKENRLWKLVYKKKVGQHISTRTIRRLAHARGVHNPLSFPIKEVKFRMREAEKNYKSFVPHAATERKRFYEEMASANAMNNNSKKETILKRIMNNEESREHGRYMRRFPPPQMIMKRVDRVTYMVDGMEKEAHSPGHIVQQIQQETKAKYTSSLNTPLMQPLSHDLLGNFANTTYANNLREGRGSYTDFPKWTATMLKRLEKDPKINVQQSILTSEEIRSVWRNTKEHKASSMSNRYNAVYKSMCKDIQLLQLLTHTMNLPFMLGVPYRRWSNFLDIMSFKKKDSINVSTLRTIIISEADWNASGKIFITRRMMQNAEAQQLLPREHMGGRKGKKATDGALTKRLILDNSRLTGTPMAVVSTDAANCYDRMIHKFIAMACIKWGVPSQVITPLLAPLHEAKHYTRTAFGDSDTYFGGEGLQGAGQGNTGAAPYWTCVSSHMINVLKDHLMQATYITPLDKKKIELALIAFVDDTELFLTVPNNNIQDLTAKAERAINMWREVLEVTGGAMRPTKCAWTILAYDGKYPRKLLPLDKVKADIHIPTEDGDISEITQYCSSAPRRYLGVEQQATGEDTYQLKEMYDKVEVWNQQLRKTPAQQHYNMRSTMSKIHKSISYPLPTLTLTEQQCHKLSNKLYSSVLPKCGVSSKFPTIFRYLPHKYQGLALPKMYVNQELAKLQETITMSETNSICWDQLNLGLQALQLDIGVQKLPYNYSFTKYAHLTQPTWILSQWKFVSDQKLIIKNWSHDLPALRKGDCYIMESMVNKGIPKSDLKTVNKCRKYLQVMTLSEICTGEGGKINLSIYECPYKIPSLDSPYEWPKVSKPTLKEWGIWKQSVRSVFCRTSSSDTLRVKLGPWNENVTKRGHKWYYHPALERLFKVIGPSNVRVYKKTSTNRSSTRSNLHWFQLVSIRPYDKELILECEIATLQVQKSANQHLIACNGWGLLSKIETIARIGTEANSRTVYNAMRYLQFPQWIYQHMPNQIRMMGRKEVREYMCTNLRLAVDGSYKENDSSAALIIEPLHSPISNIIIPIRTPANTKGLLQNDSYRAEVSGILTGLHMIRAMEQMTQITTRITISCDNDRALDATQSYTYTNSKTKHFDMVKSIIFNKKHVRSELFFERVQGHVDESKKTLTRTEFLNKHCDLIAKEARCLPAIPSILNNCQGEGLSVWTSPSKKIYTDLMKNLLDKYMDAKAQKALCEKYVLTKAQFQSIAWVAIDTAASYMSSSTKQWVSKFITRFLPIGKNMVRRSHWQRDYCPRCKTHIETHDHLLQCPHFQSTATFKKSLQELEKWLVSMDTPDSMTHAIIVLITEWRLGQPISTHRLYPPPINNQIVFGWRHFMEGRPLKLFTTYMQDHYTKIGSKRSGHKWTAYFIFNLWTLVYRPQWEDRNSFVHNSNAEAETTRTRENLITEATTLYLSELQDNLLAKDQHLMDEPLSLITQGVDAHIRAWIAEFKIAILERDRFFIPNNRLQSAFLRNWMRYPTSRRPIFRERNPRKTTQKKRVRTKPRKRPALISPIFYPYDNVSKKRKYDTTSQPSHRKVPRKK